MPLYLAQVQRKPLSRRVELHLLAIHYKKDDLWTKLAETEVIAISPDSTKLADDVLALVTLSAERRLINITDAASNLPLILHNLSLRLLKLSTKEQEIKEWKESLVYQSSVLSDRALELDKRSERINLDVLNHRAVEIQEREEELNKQALNIAQSVNKLKEWQKELNQEHSALQRAWQALNLEREAMEKK